MRGARDFRYCMDKDDGDSHDDEHYSSEGDDGLSENLGGSTSLPEHGGD